MSSTLRLLAASLIAGVPIVGALAMGCDDAASPNPPAAVLHDADPVPITEYCTRLSAEVCALLEPCCLASPFSFDSIKCHQHVRSLCSARVASAISANAGYDDFEAGRCLGGIPALVSNCRLVLDQPRSNTVLESCRTVVHGSVPTIDQCSDAGLVSGCTCDPSVRTPCAPPAPGVRVRCLFGVCRAAPLLEAGAACIGVDGRCDRGLTCQGDGFAARCVPNHLGLGEACVPFSSPQCAPAYQCDDKQHVCVALPADGDPCSSVDVCAPGFRCDTNKSPSVCVALGLAGAPCADASECASGACVSLACVGDPSRVADPLSCEGFAFGTAGAPSLAGEAVAGASAIE